MTEKLPAATRLKMIREGAGIGLRDLARRINKSTSTYAHYEDPERFKSGFLPVELAMEIALQFPSQKEKDEIYRLAGFNGAPPAEHSGSEESLAGSPDPTIVDLGERVPPGTITVPCYDVHVHAGPGAFVDDYEVITSVVAFPGEYLRRITETDRKHLGIISVTGNSMTPTLHHDDIVMVDTTKKDINFDGMFVARIDGLLRVKRLDWDRYGETILVQSDNKVDNPDRVRPASEVEVVGRVAWSGKKYF